MTQAFLQEKDALPAYQVTSAPLVFASDVTAGSAVWVVVTSSIGLASQLPTDSQGNTYTQIGGANLGASSNAMYHYWTAITTSGPLTVTANGGGAFDTIAAYAAEISNSASLLGHSELGSDPSVTDANGVVSGTANITGALPGLIVALDLNAEGSQVGNAGTSPIAFTGSTKVWTNYLSAGAGVSLGLPMYAPLVSSPSTVQATSASVAFQHHVMVMAVFGGPPPPTITVEPVDTRVPLGATATLSVTATAGVGPLAYQWQVNTGSGFSDISGATSSTYTTAALAYSDNATSYQCVLTDTGNTLTSTTNVVRAIADFNEAGSAALRSFPTFGAGAFGAGAFGPFILGKAVTGGTTINKTLSASTTSASIRLAKTAIFRSSTSSTLASKMTKVFGSHSAATPIVPTHSLSALISKTAVATSSVVKSVQTSKIVSAITTETVSLVRLIKQTRIASSISVGFASASTGLRNLVLTAVVTSTGLVQRSTSTLRAGAIAVHSILSRTISNIHSAATALQSVSSRQIQIVRNGMLASQATLNRLGSHLLTASTVVSGQFASIKAKLLMLSAALSSTGSLGKNILSFRVASTLIIASAKRNIFRVLSAATALVSNKFILINKTFVTSVLINSFQSAIRAKILVLSAAINLTGNISKIVNMSRTVSLGISGSIGKALTKIIAAILNSVADLNFGARLLMLTLSAAVSVSAILNIVSGIQNTFLRIYRFFFDNRVYRFPSDRTRNYRFAADSRTFKFVSDGTRVYRFPFPGV